MRARALFDVPRGLAERAQRGVKRFQIAREGARTRTPARLQFKLPGGACHVGGSAADARGADAIGGRLRGLPAEGLGDALHEGVEQCVVFCEQQGARAGLVGGGLRVVTEEGEVAVPRRVQILRRGLPREL